MKEINFFLVLYLQLNVYLLQLVFFLLMQINIEGSRSKRGKRVYHTKDRIKHSSKLDEILMFDEVTLRERNTGRRRRIAGVRAMVKPSKKKT